MYIKVHNKYICFSADSCFHLACSFLILGGKQLSILSDELKFNVFDRTCLFPVPPGCVAITNSLLVYMDFLHPWS